MSNIESKASFEEHDCRRFSGDKESFAVEEDMLLEHILENINSTPIGQVLKKIATLPEIRQEKVLEVRTRLTKGQYDLNRRLDVVLDKVLEDLIA